MQQAVVSFATRKYITFCPEARLKTPSRLTWGIRAGTSMAEVDRCWRAAPLKNRRGWRVRRYRSACPPTRTCRGELRRGYPEEAREGAPG